MSCNNNSRSAASCNQTVYRDSQCEQPSVGGRSQVSFSTPTVDGVPGKVSYANPQIKYQPVSFKFTAPLLGVTNAKVHIIEPQKMPEGTRCGTIECAAPKIITRKTLVTYNPAELKCSQGRIVAGSEDSGCGSRGPLVLKLEDQQQPDARSRGCN